MSVIKKDTIHYSELANMHGNCPLHIYYSYQLKKGTALAVDLGFVDKNGKIDPKKVVMIESI